MINSLFEGCESKIKFLISSRVMLANPPTHFIQSGNLIIPTKKVSLIEVKSTQSTLLEVLLRKTWECQNKVESEGSFNFLSAKRLEIPQLISQIILKTIKTIIIKTSLQ